MSDASLNVFQRINMAAGYLSETSWYKDGKNSQFSSVTIDQIRREVIKAETLAGLVVTYDELDIGTQEFNGKTYCRIKARLTYVNVDDPEDTVAFVKTGIAQDSADKGWNKAESMVYKNLYKALYYIGDREDDADSMSGEEYDLLAVFRCPIFHDELVRYVTNSLPKAKAWEEEQREAERRKLRQFKAEQMKAQENARLIAKSKERQEADAKGAEVAAVEQIGEDKVGEKMAEHYGVDLGKAKQAVIVFHNKHIMDEERNPVLAKYIEDHDGTFMVGWSPSTILECYRELVLKKFIEDTASTGVTE